MKGLLHHHKNLRKLTTLVENQTTYSANHAELHIFETHKVAEKVALEFGFPIIASMLTGKKVMHLNNMPSFQFLPGESVVLPSNEKMIIDFPMATKENPTQCLALGINPEKINEVVYNFNELTSIERENNQWKFDDMSSHLTNNIEVNQLINRLVGTFTKNTQSKDILLDLMIQELIVRLLQSKARHLILKDYNTIFSDSRIGTVIKFIKNHLTEKDITLDTLANKACMSKSHFSKKFKNTLGISPIDYINSEKIKFAKKLMKDNPKYMIADIAFRAGFNNVSYFNRQFKKYEMITPQQFKNTLFKKQFS